MKKISIITSCYNEEENLPEFYRQLMEVIDELKGRYSYEIIIADNNSTDRSPKVLRDLASRDKNVKVIFNSRNFGPDRSGYNALMQATGDAIVAMASDLQNPPGMIKQFIEKWEQGYKVVITVKTGSKESFVFYILRTIYYKTLAGLSNVNLFSHFTGFGLYDRQVIEILRNLQDPYPYFRGLIADIGFEPAIIEFVQPPRVHGKTKSNFQYLYEEAMLGLTSYTKVPLRLATIVGFLAAGISFFIGMFYLVYKVLFWTSFSVGTAPVTIGLFFFASIQLIFLGIIGEYISMIYIHVLNRPLVFEKERINFDHETENG
jgi:glycosyltransferase involved in cell wall biosynthesis